MPDGRGDTALMLKRGNEILKFLRRHRYFVPALLAVVTVILIASPFVINAILNPPPPSAPPGEVAMDETKDFNLDEGDLHWVHYNVENVNGSFYHQYMTEPQKIWVEIQVIEEGPVSVDVTRHIYHSIWLHVFKKTNFFYVNTVLNLTMWGTYNFEFSGSDLTVVRVRIVVLEPGKMII